MLASTERVLTTHAGSLPRTPRLVEMHVASSNGRAVDPAELAREVEVSTRQAVQQQLEIGIDVANDGEQSRESFVTYVQHRLTGYSGESQRAVMKDVLAYPTFLRLKMPDYTREMVNLMRAPKATADVTHATLKPLTEECDRFDAALKGRSGFAERFLTAASPGIICSAMLNDHYASYEDYVFAVADALRPEYEYTVSRGYVLQLDCPDLAMEWHISYADRSFNDFLAFVRTNIAAINRAIAGLPRDRIRLHVCWGNYEGPHTFDAPMEAILPLLYEANVGAILLPFANPRHAHEWRALQRFPLPDGMLLIAGVIDTTTNYVEHPQVVADRIETVARAVGDPRRVLAGTDCGFATAAGFGDVAEEVAWEKLRSLAAGAALVSVN